MFFRDFSDAEGHKQSRIICATFLVEVFWSPWEWIWVVNLWESQLVFIILKEDFFPLLLRFEIGSLISCLQLGIADWGPGLLGIACHTCLLLVNFKFCFLKLWGYRNWSSYSPDLTSFLALKTGFTVLLASICLPYLFWFWTENSLLS